MVAARAPLDFVGQAMSPKEDTMLHANTLMLLIAERQNELRTRAANEAVLSAMNAEKRRARRAAALAAIERAAMAKEEKDRYGWQSQRSLFRSRRLPG